MHLKHVVCEMSAILEKAKCGRRLRTYQTMNIRSPHDGDMYDWIPKCIIRLHNIWHICLEEGVRKKLLTTLLFTDQTNEWFMTANHHYDLSATHWNGPTEANKDLFTRMF